LLGRVKEYLPSIFRRYQEKRSQPADHDDFWYEAVAAIRSAAAGIPVTAETAMRCSVFRASVQGIADDLSTIPLPVYDGSGEAPKKVKNHPLWRVLQVEMNPEMSAADGRSLWATHRLQYGSAYSWIEFNAAGDVKALWPMHPNYVTVRRDRSTGDLFYEYRPPGEPQRVYLPWQVLHFKDLSDDGVTARRLIDDGKDSIALAIAAERFAGHFFGQGAHIGGVVEVEENFDDPAFKRFVNELETKRSGLSNSHRPMVLEGGAKWKPSGIDPRAAQTVEIMRIAGENVMRLFRTQPTMVQDNERSTFTNASTQTLNHVKFTLRPPGVRTEKELDRKLLLNSEADIYTRHNFDAILRGDIEARGTYYKVMVAAGILTRNEARLLEERAPIEGGDELWVPVNSMPISGPLANQSQEPTDADPGNEGGAENEPKE